MAVRPSVLSKWIVQLPSVSLMSWTWPTFFDPVESTVTVSDKVFQWSGGDVPDRVGPGEVNEPHQQTPMGGFVCPVFDSEHDVPRPPQRRSLGLGSSRVLKPRPSKTVDAELVDHQLAERGTERVTDARPHRRLDTDEFDDDCLPRRIDAGYGDEHIGVVGDKLDRVGLGPTNFCDDQTQHTIRVLANDGLEREPGRNDRRIVVNRLFHHLQFPWGVRTCRLRVEQFDPVAAHSDLVVGVAERNTQPSQNLQRHDHLHTLATVKSTRETQTSRAQTRPSGAMDVSPRSVDLRCALCADR